MSVRRRKVQERLRREADKARLIADLKRFGIGLERATAIVVEARKQGFTDLTAELIAKIMAALDPAPPETVGESHA